jgi:hypothetical protein
MHPASGRVLAGLSDGEQFIGRRPMEVTNLTGHDITVFDSEGREEVIQSDGYRVRVVSRTKKVGSVTVGAIQVPLLEVEERAMMEVPVGNGLYIVSGLVAAYADRDDFVVPSRAVRNATGRVLGCRAFARYLKRREV